MEKTAEIRGLAAATANAYTRKWTFLAVFLLVLSLSYSFLSAAGLDPELVIKNPLPERPQLAAAITGTLPVEAPMRVYAEAIDMDVAVANPTSTKIETLDAALLKGAVRYPTSAKLGEEGNVVLFGHSSYLPVVNNEAFKAFNGIQNLTAGDRITVEGNGHVYVYEVKNVYSANASEDAIPLTKEGHTLTLVTCDSFASKQDRFVAVATLVESYPLAK